MRSCRGASWTRLGQATLCLETNVSFVCRSGRSSRPWRCRFSWHRSLDALARRMAYRNDGTAIVRTCLSRHCIGPPAALRRRSGDLALPFWIGFVLLGILIPAAVLVLSSFSPMFRFGNFIGLISAAAAAAAIARTTELLGGASSWRFFLT